MVSLLWSLISLTFGLLVFLLVPIVGGMLPPRSRNKIADYYYKNAMRSLQRAALIRRVMGGYSLLPLGVDNEQKLAKATLSSNIISDDKTLPFKDPDNRIQRLYSKPLALVFEDTAAAVDAELAEIGYWTLEQDFNHGLERGDKVSPFIRMDRSLRLVDPLDILPMVSKSVPPGNIQTVKKLTQERFRKYQGRVGVAEMAGILTGFLVGAGGVIGIQYMKSSVLDLPTGGGGGGPVPVPPLGGGQILPIDFLLDVAMILV